MIYASCEHHNEPNPILIAYRKEQRWDGESESAYLAWWLRNLDLMRVFSRSEIDHARRVLERLARLADQ